MEGNIASSGPCWTITMQSNPNRDVCRKQHVCNYCLMRLLSQAECPIRLPMRKRRQGPLPKEKEREWEMRGLMKDREEGSWRTEMEDVVWRMVEKMKTWERQGKTEEKWRSERQRSERRQERKERKRRNNSRAKCAALAEMITLNRG